MIANTKKIILLVSILFLNFFQTKAQTFGNEWINYSQSYYKFPITTDGIYRINFNTLQSAGIPINTLNPQNIQLFEYRQQR